MILLIDNYDSFTFNIAQYVLQITPDLVVRRNDEISIDQVREMNPNAILISPGPCTPDKAGIAEDVIREFADSTPIFGVCLGMQAIGEVYGGEIVQAERIMHGKESLVSHDEQGVFESVPNPFRAIRYHSLAVDRESLPDELVVTASSEDGEIMGLRHRTLDVEGVQFHPESILTQHGNLIIENWVNKVIGKSLKR
ncbi:MAG: aminodeoxychorismate/anthranilate synthase component II [Fimbriimonadales bacterium]|nr:aminodeoxychorismate/anthranilate synthase component II [Fimbriimonadales bacterium]